MANFLKHIGMPRRSGRYPWGSGKDPQRNKDFVQTVKELRKQGLNEIEIAKGLGINTSELRKKYRIELANRKKSDIAMAIRLKEKGLSNPAIGERMGGVNESTVRGWLKESNNKKSKILESVSKVLKERANESKFIDVGIGIETQLGISRTALLTSIHMLKKEGYQLHTIRYQTGDKKFTKFSVLVPPGVTYRELLANRHNIKMINDYSDDGGITIRKIEPIKSIDSKRVKIKYQEDGGGDTDGLIELRRGVEDLSLGGKKYAQVRIGVDGTHFMKGMAIYSDDIPNGYDIVYNTKKKKGTPNDKVFKPLERLEDGEVDQSNPFGSSIKQRFYIDKNGKEQLSPLNRIGSGDKIQEEGAWLEWRRTISSQVLSKQRPAVAKKQLDLAAEIKEEDFDEIMSLTNPAVKKVLLKTFSEKCDKAAEELKAAAFPRQNTHVILPFKSIKENEVFAPQYNNGEPVVLIRHPHGGLFEIPELIVNNRNKEAIRAIGKKPLDAIGINPKTALKLSGADFDGDTVLVIPNKSGAIKKDRSQKSLLEFDPRTSYPLPDNAPRMSSISKGLRMGDVSNLITDMTIKGAPLSEIVRAVKHSMVVIDAEKHHLDYKKSAIDFNIAELKSKYQGGPTSGAATIVSRAKSKEYVPERENYNPFAKGSIDPKTGQKIYKLTNATYFDRGKYSIDPNTGKKVYEREKGIVKPRMTVTTKMDKALDAMELSSGTEMEKVYADYANRMKKLANQSRLAILNTPDIEYSPSANKIYAEQVAKLNASLNIALKNKPFERQAQLIATKTIATKRRSNPNMDAKTLKKIRGIEIENARAKVGANKISIKISDKDWEAIQAGALTNNKLLEILKNTDLKELKQRALPRNYIGMSPAKISRARIMLSAGHTRAEIADALGVSTSLLIKALE